MRAILIAPDLADKNLLVQELEHDGELQSIYASLDCNLIDCIRLDDRGNVMYVDDEGYMTKNTFFLFGQYPMPLAGRCANDSQYRCTMYSGTSLSYCENRRPERNATH
jgi:hypothetical protein